jgi:hypothetical protein
MATILIIPDGPSAHRMTVGDRISLATLDNEDVDPWWVATCTCGMSGTDRGHFGDTTQWALVHVEGAHE